MERDRGIDPIPSLLSNGVPTRTRRFASPSRGSFHRHSAAWRRSRVDGAFDQPVLLTATMCGKLRERTIPALGDVRVTVGRPTAPGRGGKGHECTVGLEGSVTGRSRAARRGRSSRPAQILGPHWRRTATGGLGVIRGWRRSRGDGGAERRGADRDASHPRRRCVRRRAGGRRRPRLRLESTDCNGPKTSLTIPTDAADAGGDGPAPAWRGPARGLWRTWEPSCASPGLSGRRLPSGPERQKRARCRTSTAGRPGSPDAGAGGSGVWRSSCRESARGPLQVRGGQPGWHVSLRLTRSRSPRRCRRPLPASSRPARTSGRTRVDRRAGQRGPHARSGLDL